MIDPTHAEFCSDVHLYTASPNARVGCNPPWTRPFRITLFASDLGCSAFILPLISFDRVRSNFHSSRQVR
jgi:hypothetical protein